MSDGFDGRATSRRQTIPLRPLKGIYRDVSPTLVPKGGFTMVNGYIPSDIGLARRFGFTTVETTFPAITRWDYLNSFVDDRGAKITFGIGDGVFYELSGSGFVAKDNVYPNTTTATPGTVTVAIDDRTLIGSTGVTWKDDAGLTRGDTITIVDTGEVLTVDYVIGNEQVRVYEPPTLVATDSDYYFTRLLTPASEWPIQAVRLDRTIYIVTGKNTIMCYNIDHPSNVYTYWEMNEILGGSSTYPSAKNFVPKTISVYKDRIWYGNIFRDDLDRWQPDDLCWTPILEPLGFNPALHYITLVTVGGEITCVMPMGNLLMVYFEFGLQYGRDTLIPGDTLPLAFDTVPTNRRGVLQPNAVATTRGGHLFVSTDGAYAVDASLNYKRISHAVDELMFRTEIVKNGYNMISFVEAEGFAIGASTQVGGYTEIWVFNVNTNEWTMFDVSADYLATFAIGSRLTFGDYPEGQIYGADPADPCGVDNWPDKSRDPTTEYFTAYDVQTTDMSAGFASPALSDLVPYYAYSKTDTPNPVVKSIVLDTYTLCQEVYNGNNVEATNDRFYMTTGNLIHRFDPLAYTDYNGQPILIELETGDLDMELPDTYKSYYQIALRLAEQAHAELSFHIEASDDSGITWYDMGDLIVYQDGKEGRCNFIHTGTASRFRLTSNTVIDAYKIIEITLDVKQKGKQFGDY